MAAGFISEWWPASNRNGGRLQIGKPGRHKSESALFNCLAAVADRRKGKSSKKINTAIDLVPELTRGADIKLNARVSLRRPSEILSWWAVVRMGPPFTYPRPPCVPRDQGSPQAGVGGLAPIVRPNRRRARS